MNVSNSTGQNTGYRVVGAGGNTSEDELLVVNEVWLEPGQTETHQDKLPCGSFRVTFISRDKKEIASATFLRDPGMVELVQEEWGFCILRSENGCTGESSSSSDRSAS